MNRSSSSERRFACFTLLYLALLSAVLLPARALACGCFAPPDVATPLLQAGEKIVFVLENGQVEMHVQLRYSGRSGDFGWLLPLPSVPKTAQGQDGIDIGADELFDQLESRTQPYYILTRQAPICASASSIAPPSGCGGRGPGCGSSSIGGADPGWNGSEGSSDVLNQPQPLVKQDSVGPYDFAILRADNKDALLQWLKQSGYVVPAGTDQVLAPYIRPGAYILALKLRAGATAGDIQPVVLRYASDLPMIPITLTSTAAVPQMPIQVWVLANARAIPRNYHHVEINELQLDWLNQVWNYTQVAAKALSEAPQKHAFLTEFAGRSEIMKGVLDTPDRFSLLPALSSENDPVRAIQSLMPSAQSEGGSASTPIQYTRNVRGFALNGQLFSVLGVHIPMPRALVQLGVSPQDYYQKIDYYLRTDRARSPWLYADIEAKLQQFDPTALRRDLDERIVQPTLRAGALFQDPALSHLTRLYTALSPEDMTVDPVFSLSSESGSVSNIHRATLEQDCAGGGTLHTESSLQRELSAQELDAKNYSALSAPYSLRSETLRESGPPEILADNRSAIHNGLSPQGQGCVAANRRSRPNSAAFPVLLAVALVMLLVRRRLSRAIRVKRSTP